MNKITLLVLIEAWLKTRGLKWKCDPEMSQLYQKKDPLDIKFKIDKTKVTFTPTTLRDGSEDVSLNCSDPDFFPKLEEALRHEERWTHAADCFVLLYNGVAAAWGPMLNVVIPWLIDRIEDVARWYEAIKDKYFPSKTQV